MGEYGLHLQERRTSVDPKEWLCTKIGLIPTPDLRVLPHIADGEIIGVVGYDGWNGSACDIHWAGSHWTPRFLAAALFYPFVVEECKVVIARVPSGNTESAKLVGRLGFQRVVSICDGHPDGYMHIFVLRRENCKLLERYYHGYEVKAS